MFQQEWAFWAAWGLGGLAAIALVCFIGRELIWGEEWSANRVLDSWKRFKERWGGGDDDS